jgi:hypothetical protein
MSGCSVCPVPHFSSHFIICFVIHIIITPGMHPSGNYLLIVKKKCLSLSNKTLPQDMVMLLLVVIECIYLPPTYLHFIQDIEYRCLLVTSSMSFVDLPFQEHRMTEKHHMDQNPYMSSLCPKPGVVTNNIT